MHNNIEIISLASNNETNFQLLAQTVKKEVTLSNRVMSMSIFGSDVYEKYPELFEISKHINSYRGKQSNVTLKVFSEAIFRNSKRQALIVEVSERLRRQLSKESIEKLKHSSDVLSLLEHGMEAFEVAGKCHMVASNNSIIFQLFAFSILVGKSKELTMDHQNDIAVILGTINDVESANIPIMIQEIANEILKNGQRDEFLELDNTKAVDWMKKNSKDVYVQFEAYVARHGHRALNELDLIAIPWENQPEKIIDMIKSNLKVTSGVSNSHKPKSMTAEVILAKVKTPLGKIAKFFLAKLLPKCQKGVQSRELAKSHLVRVVNEIRRTFTYLGTLMVHEGLLPEKDLIFYMSIEEIRDVITTHDGKLVSKAIRRKKLVPKLNELKFPEISFGTPRPIVAETLDINNNVQKGDLLVKGVPVCGGIVTADACVCKSFADVHKIKKGDILITYGTDIAWSPYFPILSGVCTEIGNVA